MLDAVTLIVPYYRNPKMLREHAREWLDYPHQFRIVVVDDGSPDHPAIEVILDEIGSQRLEAHLSVYRIDIDIPWNRGGARNLGSSVAQTDWLVHVDVDHLLPSGCARSLLTEDVKPRQWYRFPRFRRGAADETRKKDALPESQEFGPIHPHIDSYLIPRRLFWSVGGYDEDYSGCLGGGSPFLKNLEARCPVRELSSNTFLVVYTRHVVDDASDNTLSRDTSEYSRRRREKERARNTKPTNPLRFPWTQVL